MDVDFEQLKRNVHASVHEVSSGAIDPIRHPSVQLKVVRGLQGEVKAGKFTYRTDAALDAGGFAEHPRPMDYLLGAMTSCQQMWCLRWAALRERPLTELVITAESTFSWRGEYLEEIDAGISQLDISYTVDAAGLTLDEACDMADMVARRCPVVATLRRASPIVETIRLSSGREIVRLWKPGSPNAEVTMP